VTLTWELSQHQQASNCLTEIRIWS
jgi:hypothetical protein